MVVPVPARPVSVDRLGAGGREGYYLYGITRGRGWRRRLRAVGDRQLRRVRFRDLEAIVTIAPYDLPGLGPSELAAHQVEVGALSSRFTILPAPPGVVFAGRRPLVRFLDEQYLPLVEGLTLLEGHWEFRVHIEHSGASPSGNSTRALARLYSDLRGLARAAVTFPRREDRLLSWAFLVERSRWVEFVEEAEELGAARPDLALDLTGPWPPYDFVRLIV